MFIFILAQRESMEYRIIELFTWTRIVSSRSGGFHPELKLFLSEKTVVTLSILGLSELLMSSITRQFNLLIYHGHSHGNHSSGSSVGLSHDNHSSVTKNGSF